MDTYMHKTMVSVASLEKIEIIRSQEFMPSEARLKFLKKMIILGPKTAILGPQFCRILVLGPHFSLADPEGCCQHAPPNRIDFFHFCRKVYTLEVGAPQWIGTPSNRKSWICHCFFGGQGGPGPPLDPPLHLTLEWNVKWMF